MSIHLIQNWDKPVQQVRTFQCDYRTDIANLPKQNTPTAEYPKGVAAGSKAYVTEDFSIWVLTNADIWKEA